MLQHDSLCTLTEGACCLTWRQLFDSKSFEVIDKCREAAPCNAMCCIDVTRVDLLAAGSRRFGSKRTRVQDGFRKDWITNRSEATHRLLKYQSKDEHNPCCKGAQHMESKGRSLSMA